MENDFGMPSDGGGAEPIPAAGGFAERSRPAVTLEVARGAARHMRALGFAVVQELMLAGGRRADIAALGPKGEIWIVEVKSGPEDFRTDRKWPDYRMHCDRLLFAVAPDFPTPLIPDEAGLLVADGYGAALIREGLHHPLGGATRKHLLIRFGQAAALRLHALHDPDLLGGF